MGKTFLDVARVSREPLVLLRVLLALMGARGLFWFASRFEVEGFWGSVGEVGGVAGEFARDTLPFSSLAGTVLRGLTVACEELRDDCSLSVLATLEHRGGGDLVPGDLVFLAGFGGGFGGTSSRGVSSGNSITGGELGGSSQLLNEVSPVLDLSSL